MLFSLGRYITDGYLSHATTFITQTNYCAMSTESQDDHIRSLISNSLGELTTNIAAVVDNRLSEFKRQLEESQDETAETTTAK